MSWVEEFYSETGRWWGGAESAIRERDHRRVVTAQRLTGVRSGRLIDLGSSYGNTAAAFAVAGYTVTGVEISDRIDFADQHLAHVRETDGAGELSFLRADFSSFEPDAPVDLVTYWNGFGVGSDADQRRLLAGIATWLRPGGCLVLDVFNPVRWIDWSGDHTRRDAAPDEGYPYGVAEYTDYDPVQARFIDTWTVDDHPRQWTQSQRCYAPADLLLLLEPTGLELIAMEVDGHRLDTDVAADSSHALTRHHEYQVALRRPA